MCCCYYCCCYGWGCKITQLVARLWLWYYLEIIRLTHFLLSFNHRRCLVCYTHTHTGAHRESARGIAGICVHCSVKWNHFGVNNDDIWFSLLKNSLHFFNTKWIRQFVIVVGPLVCALVCICVAVCVCGRCLFYVKKPAIWLHQLWLDFYIIFITNLSMLACLLLLLFASFQYALARKKGLLPHH